VNARCLSQTRGDAAELAARDEWLVKLSKSVKTQTYKSVANKLDL
jgi:hypothetical protein